MKYIILFISLFFVLKAQDVPQSEIVATAIQELPSNMPYTIVLTDAEKIYLQKKQKLKICVDPNWMPLEKLENGVHIGIGADMIEKISIIIETPIEIVPTKTWEETIQKAKKRECDIISVAQKTPEREKYLDFTTPFLEVPIVIATKLGIPFIDDFEKIKDKKLAIVKNYSIKELLENNYKEIDLREVQSIQEGLEKVGKGEVFGFLDNSIVINYELLQLQKQEIGISGQFQDTFSLSIASRNDEPMLNEILQKALDTIDVQEREQIKNRWQNIVFEVKANYDMVITIFIFSMILVSLLVYWNLKLKKEIRKKEKVKEALRQSERRFRTLFDIAPVMINAFDKENNIILWNKECEKVFGWSLEDLKNAEKPISHFYPDPKDQETLILGLMDKEDVFYRKWQPF
ncbi:MAG: transporter substrate-binding domain-containing protein, partial [Sulfurimonadaceae bacterium]|nr:transporter substrate-binding domain-containing protein [Sulfurimonadaceae bacterium]